MSVEVFFSVFLFIFLCSVLFCWSCPRRSLSCIYSHSKSWPFALPPFSSSRQSSFRHARPTSTGSIPPQAPRMLSLTTTTTSSISPGIRISQIHASRSGARPRMNTTHVSLFLTLNQTRQHDIDLETFSVH